MQPVCLINAVGLTPRHIGPNTPNLLELSERGFFAPMQGVIPAVTCSAQATLLTGLSPQEHGVVGNGWHFRETGETRFWLQSNALVHGEKIYEAARKQADQRGEEFSCAKLFWWFNQGAAVEYSITPKPHYGADGSKKFDILSSPPDLANALEQRLGKFPFHSFWGPRAGLPCSEWIAKAAVEILLRSNTTLTMVYLPHLDYDFQRFGPDFLGAAKRVHELDALVGKVAHAAEHHGAKVVVVSEYGIQPVTRALHLNRLFRERGWLAVRQGPFGEMLDMFRSKVFAVADHQVAHIYVQDSLFRPAVQELLAEIPGVDRVIRIEHPNAGDFLALAKPDAWFTYYYWLDDREAPDFARTVDIHRKPGYDPCELFLDPGIPFPALAIAWRLLKKTLGLRYLMDVIPLDASLVRGSHGVEPKDPLDGPIYLANSPLDKCDRIQMVEVKERILNLLFPL